MKKRLVVFITLILLGIFGYLAAAHTPPPFHPIVELETRTSGAGAPTSAPPQLQLKLAFNAVPTLQQCEATTGNVARKALAKCSICVIKKIECATQLDEDERKAFSSEPLPIPSGRLHNGVILFSGSSELARAACLESQRMSATGRPAIRCDEAGAERPPPARPALSPSLMLQTALVFLAALTGSWLVGWLIVRYEHLHAHYSHDHTHSGPQKFHATPTPRIGGIAIASGLVAAGSVILLLNDLPYEREFGLLLLAGIPAFLGGLVEDVTKKVGVAERLFLTMLSGAVAAWLLGATINRIDVLYLDEALLIPAVAVAFTIFAVGGVANAINIIDGYNGLAAGYAVIVTSALAWVSAQVGDQLVMVTAIALAGAVLGFMRWNWPCGKLFMGDGGAYLLGLLIAELAILIVLRNPEISPWFPLALLSYPVVETLYSIYRRKFRDKTSPGAPDNSHLHQLIYRYIGHKEDCRLTHNNRVAVWLWLIFTVISMISAFFFTYTEMLLGCSLLVCVIYLLSYRRLYRVTNH